MYLYTEIITKWERQKDRNGRRKQFGECQMQRENKNMIKKVRRSVVAYFWWTFLACRKMDDGTNSSELFEWNKTNLNKLVFEFFICFFGTFRQAENDWKAIELKHLNSIFSRFMLLHFQRILIVFSLSNTFYIDAWYMWNVNDLIIAKQWYYQKSKIIDDPPSIFHSILLLFIVVRSSSSLSSLPILIFHLLMRWYWIFKKFHL